MARRLVMTLSLAALVASACGPKGDEAGSELTPFDFTSGAIHLRGWVTPAVPDAPLLVVIHGGPGISHEYTRPLARLVDAGFRVAFWDQRGVGASEVVPAAAQTLEGQVTDLDALRASLDAPELVLAGQSWGGLIAIRYAIDHPERARALLLLDSVPGSVDELQDAFSRFHARRRSLAARGIVPAVLPPARGDDCVPTQLALAPVYYGDPSHPKAHDLGGSSCREGVLDSTWRNIGDFDLRDAMGRLEMPILVLSGGADPFGPEMAQDLAAAFPAARLTVREIPDCGHNGFNECPGQYFSALEGFLAGVSAAPPAR
ncbi:MAG: hypothetical protein CVU56_16040 [Deltaproteobacteria bacterium HGW-Deltaproteobacteria-14]|jgi:pimeloyl-ACP methyl ester carboxylesterase|nr:MAG: hypothetical protein CVU56_16040 [Deltaproteobacteria bacterium HGW-Deltaproteobacteria-14]